MEEQISVIIPVYNVAEFLPQCLDSVVLQDYRNLQILLVDDGSTDGSGEICDRYAAADARIQVIHQPNQGAGAAKNAGLRVAEGTYLSFVDSDDFLEPGAYREMVKTMEETQADMVQFSFRDVYRNRTEDQHLLPGPEEMDAKTYLLRFPKDWTCSLLWNKLYKRKLYDGVFFEEGRKIDDEFFTYQALLKPCKVVRRETIVYNYRKRASSVMSRPESANQRLLDCLDAIVSRREKVLAVYPELKYAFDENYLDTLWYLSGNFGCTRETIALLKRHLKAYLRTKENRFPPRYLWPMLAKLYIVPASALARACQAKEQSLGTDEYF